MMFGSSALIPPASNIVSLRTKTGIAPIVAIIVTYKIVVMITTITPVVDHQV